MATITGCVTRVASGIFKPNPRYACATAKNNILIPKSPKFSLTKPEWRSTMKDEFEALSKNNTWVLIPHSANDNVINTKWGFKIKHNEDGMVERYKARLVSNGMKQVEGIDYTKMFSRWLGHCPFM